MKALPLALTVLLAVPAVADIAPSPWSRRKNAEVEAEACLPQKGLKKVSIVLPGGKAIKADVADSVVKREKGLMCVKKMPKDYGMLFAFPGEQPLGFWMKNTLVPLDIVFIGADKKITSIAAELKASTTQTPDAEVATANGRGLYVLELAAGEAKKRKLEVGSELKFEVALPKE